MSRIALVEDHARLAQLVCRALAGVGIAVDVFPSLGSAWSAMQDAEYAAIVVDRGLPDGDGLDLVRRLRSSQRFVPCLMLTARDALHDRVEGLESGSDDYLSKPFAMEELVARVRALARRPSLVHEAEPGFGDLRLIPDAGTLCCDVRTVRLAPAEMQVMLRLVGSDGKTSRRSSLEQAGWGVSDAVSPNALDVVLHRLRRKLLAIGSSVRIINTRGHGYALLES